MKSKTLLSFMGIIFSITTINAQKIHPLTVGDKVPNITLHNIINYKDSVAKLSDFKGKLLILDFWATWCTSCIGTFPHNNTIQQQYKNKMQILNVGYEPKNKIKNFLVGLEKKSGSNYKIATVTNDKILGQLFPHQLIPHLVWIGTDGIVKAITTAKELTDSNINNLLHNEILQVRTKKDIPVKTMPLYLSNDFNSIDSLIGYSILYKGYDPGTGGTNLERNIGHAVVGKVITNYSLLKIYKIIARYIFESKGEEISNQKVVVSVPEGDRNQLQSLYGFDVVVPLKQADSLYPYALNELNRMSGFNGAVCKHKMLCLVLKKTKDSTFFNSISTALDAHLFFDGQETYLKDGKLSMLIGRLNELPGITLPVVDGTGYTSKVDIRLSGSNDLFVIRKDLQQYGLDLVEEEKEIDVLMIMKPSNAITKN